VLVGEAEPAAAAVDVLLAFLGEVAVIELDEVLRAEDADRALVQDEEIRRLRRAVPGDARIGEERDVAAGLVLDRLADGEQVMLVDGEGAAEDEALAIVVADRDRRRLGQR